jgi:hypothetical protein
MRVIALDPGGTTGWVTYQDGRFERAGQLTGEHHYALLELLAKQLPRLGLHGRPENEGPLYVVYERFDHRNNEFSRLISLEYIGIIKAFCQRETVYGVPQGSDVKAFADSGRKIDKAGWYIDYKWKHAWDAARHLFYFLINGTHMHDQYRTELLEKIK